MKKLLLVVFVVVIFITVASTGVKSKTDKKLVCDKNGDFVILIVSDPQCDNPKQWNQAREELEILVKRSNPDFVLINGDMNSQNVIPEDMWNMFVSVLEKNKIYWSTTNGNHDPFQYKYYNMYKGYEYCLNDIVNDTDINYDYNRPMNYVLPVYSNDGKDIVFAIYGMDSGTQSENGYEGLNLKQIRWYKSQSDNLRQLNNGENVTSILCMHIPLPQILEMYYGGSRIYGRANEINYSKKGYTTQSGKQISKINIHTSNIEKDNKMFNVMLQNGDIKAAFFGHNHRNNFIGSYKGVLLGFVGKISTGCYSDNVCRGGRVIRFNESNPQDFTTEWLASLKSASDQPPIYSSGQLAKQKIPRF